MLCTLWRGASNSRLELSCPPASGRRPPLLARGRPSLFGWLSSHFRVTSFRPGSPNLSLEQPSAQVSEPSLVDVMSLLKWSCSHTPGGVPLLLAEILLSPCRELRFPSCGGPLFLGPLFPWLETSCPRDFLCVPFLAAVLSSASMAGSPSCPRRTCVPLLAAERHCWQGAHTRTGTWPFHHPQLSARAEWS